MKDGPPRPLSPGRKVKKLTDALGMNKTKKHKDECLCHVCRHLRGESAPLVGCNCVECSGARPRPRPRAVTGGVSTGGQTLTLRSAAAKATDQKIVVTVQGLEKLQEANRDLHQENDRLRQVVQASREVVKHMPPSPARLFLSKAISDLDTWDYEGVDPDETKKVIDDLLRIAGELDGDDGSLWE